MTYWVAQRRTKVRRRLVGVVFLAVLASLVSLSVAVYDKKFTPVTTVVLHTDDAGNEMHVHAEVKVRGVVVGEVRRITADGSGARLELALQPDRTHLLPANVSAQLLPTTLFGERYVALMVPQAPAPQRLADGAVIGQDRSADAIELQRVLNDLLPLLQAVQPQKLAVTLTAVSQALQGRGAQLGRTLTQINGYLTEFNPRLPQLDKDISDLVAVANRYSQAAPDIVQALSDLTVTSRTVVDQQNNLNALYSTLTGTARDLDTFLSGNENTIIRLSADSTSTLRLLAKYSAEYPCVLKQLSDFAPEANKAFGKGTHEAGLHTTVVIVPERQPYLPGRDTPRYGDASGPHCYPTPFAGVNLNDGTSPAVPAAAPAGRSTTAPAAARAVLPSAAAPGGVSLANTPQENEFVNELLSPMLNVPPQSLPAWSGILVGPLYRGTEVRLK